MPDGWSVYLCNHNGLRLDDLSQNQGFEFAKVANSVGSFRVTMGQGFDDSILAKNYRIEIWRNFLGGSVLLFSGLIDRWVWDGERLHIDGKCVNALLAQRVLMPAVDWGGSYIFAGTRTDDTFQVSDDYGATWTNTGTPGMTTQGVTDSVLAADGSLLVTSLSGFGGELGKIHRTTNNGATWTLVHTEASDRGVNSICRVPTTKTLAAVTGMSGGDGRFLRSTDNGATWSVEQNTAGAAEYLSEIVVAANEDIIAGTFTGFGSDPDIWRSQDDGQSYSNVATLTGSGDYLVEALYKLRNGNLLLGTGPLRAEIWMSMDNGATWSEIVDLKASSSTDYVRDFLELPNGDILAGTRQDGRIWISYSGGYSWQILTSLAAGAISVHSLLLLNSGEVLAATDNSGKVYQSSDSLQSWAELSDTGEDIVSSLCWMNL